MVTGRVRPVDLPAFLGGAFADVARTLGEQRLGPVGPPFARYLPRPAGVDVEVGRPAGARVSSSGRVVRLLLPGGAAAWIKYRGDYACAAP